MVNFPGVQYIAGVGWVSAPGAVPAPSPYDQQAKMALGGEQDVMMISGLRGLGDGDGQNGTVAPSGFLNSMSPTSMLVIGILVGLLLGSIVLANTVKE